MIVQIHSIDKVTKRKRLLAVKVGDSESTVLEEHKKQLHPSVLKSCTFETVKVG